MVLKDEILKILEENKGNSISGEELASKLSLSRTAVWKAVTQLREDGHQILAVRNKGYSLSDNSDIVSPQGIAPYLNDKNIADKVVVLDVTDSTNQDAKRLVLEGATHQTVVIANHQTAGKGRMGRAFFSPQGMGIYMSIILKPNLTGDNALLITTAVSVAVARAIEKITGKNCLIKWVNDIFIGDKKICGILTEAVTDFESGAIDSVVVGIGVNFCGAVEMIPEELKHIVGYLFEQKPNDISRNMLAAQIINEVISITGDLKSEKFIDEYRRKSLILGQEVEVISRDKTEAATAIDVDDRGGLIVRKQSGELVTISSGEVSIRRKF